MKILNSYRQEIEQGVAVPVSISKLKKLKTEMVNHLHENDNGFIVYEFYQGYERFSEYRERLITQNISEHDKETIRALGYIIQIRDNDLEYMMKYL